MSEDRVPFLVIRKYTQELLAHLNPLKNEREFSGEDLDTAFHLSPVTFLAPLEDPAHHRFLPLYERVFTLRRWIELGFRADFKKESIWVRSVDRDLYEFREARLASRPQNEALATGKRLVEHYDTMLDYVRLGIPFSEFVSHPQHYEDFCLGSLALERGDQEVAIGKFGAAVLAAPEEVRYAERWFPLRVEAGDLSAPAEELNYYANEIDSVIHTERVYAWAKLLLAHKQVAEAAQILVRVATLLEDKIAGRLPKGRYSGDDISFVAYKRDQFRKKMDSWSRMRKYGPLMRAIEQLGGLPEMGGPNERQGDK